MNVGFRTLTGTVAVTVVCLGTGIGAAHAEPPWSGKCEPESVTASPGQAPELAKKLVIQHCQRAHSAATRQALIADAISILSGAVGVAADRAKEAADQAVSKASDASTAASGAAEQADQATASKAAAAAAARAAAGGVTDAEVDAAATELTGTAAANAGLADKGLAALADILRKSKTAAQEAETAGNNPDDVDIANKAATAENEAVAAFADGIKKLGSEKFEGLGDMAVLQNLTRLEIDTTPIPLVEQ